MNHKYIVTLIDEERAEIKQLIQKGKTQGYRIKHAQILLKLDNMPQNDSCTYERIKEAFSVTPHTISHIAKRFVRDDLESALGRKVQENRFRKIDGYVETQMIALACSEAPQGREHWTLQLIADELVRLNVVDSISDTTVLNTLKNELKPWQKKNGAFQNQELNS